MFNAKKLRDKTIEFNINKIVSFKEHLFEEMEAAANSGKTIFYIWYDDDENKFDLDLFKEHLLLPLIDLNFKVQIEEYTPDYMGVDYNCIVSDMNIERLADFKYSEFPKRRIIISWE